MVKGNQLSNFQFDANTHSYLLNGADLPSVSRLIKQWAVFDEQAISKRVATRRKVDQQVVLDEWKHEADLGIKKGNIIHDFGESIVRIIQSGFKEVTGMVNFWADMFDEDTEIILAEEPMYSAKYLFAGTPDLVVRKIDQTTGEVYNVMFDYKTNKDLYKNYKGKRLLKPFDDLLDSPLSKYYIQQNLYKLLLEENGVDIEEMYVIWLKDSKYEIIDIPKINVEERIWLQQENILV